MRQFQRLVLLVLVVAAFAALLVTPTFAADATPVQPQPAPLPVTGIAGSSSLQMQWLKRDLPKYDTAITIEVPIPGDIYVGCSSFDSTVTAACMQSFCSAQAAGDAVLKDGVYRCVNNFTPQTAPAHN